MQITLEFLEEKNACSDGIDFFKEHFCTVKSLLENIYAETDHKELITTLLKHGRYDYAAWTISRMLSTIDCVKFAVYCAELVLHVVEDKYPNDKKPKKAILAAKKFLKNNNYANSTVAAAAADAAYYAADAAAYAAYYAASAYASAKSRATDAVAAAYAASTASHAATCAAYAAYYATSATDTAHAAPAASTTDAVAAAAAASTASYAAIAGVTINIKQKIINYGIKLIDEEEKQ